MLSRRPTRCWRRDVSEVLVGDDNCLTSVVPCPQCPDTGSHLSEADFPSASLVARDAYVNRRFVPYKSHFSFLLLDPLWERGSIRSLCQQTEKNHSSMIWPEELNGLAGQEKSISYQPKLSCVSLEQPVQLIIVQLMREYILL